MAKLVACEEELVEETASCRTNAGTHKGGGADARTGGPARRVRGRVKYNECLYNNDK